MIAVAYARYSSDNQREESIDAQLREINKYAAAEGITIARAYIDEALTARTDNRPEFLKMMKDAEAGGFECVIVHKLDRFSRDRYDSAFYKRHLKRHGIKLISVLERLTDSPESIILESVLEGMAEYYSANLAREVMKGMKETAYQCKHNGGIPPLGYDVNSDKTYKINENEACAVRMIFDMYLNGQGYSSIIDALREKGYKTKTGKDFAKNSLYSILSNEKYSGIFIFNRTERKMAGKRNGHKAKKEEEIIKVPGGMPAIISTETWERAKKKMENNRHSTGAYSAKTIYLLSGHIICGECGSAMTGKRYRMGRNKVYYAYYECGARKRNRNCSMKAINRDMIDALAIDALYDNVFSAKAIKKAANKIYEFSQKQRNEIPAYVKEEKKRLNKIDREITNIVSAISQGMFHSSMKEKMDELEASKAAIVLRIGEAERHEKAMELTKEQVVAFLSRYSDIKNMAIAEQKRVIELFKLCVVAYENYIDIDVSPWNPPPGGNGNGGGKAQNKSSNADDIRTLCGGGGGS